jgi:large subunit ribosomal protein L24
MQSASKSAVQKVFHRTALAKRQAARKSLIWAKKKEKDERRLRSEERARTRIFKKEILRDARVARQQLWEMGPLAPRRDIGDKADTYGTMPIQLMQGMTVPEKQRMKYWNFAEADRVVVIRGREKGKIGKIWDIDTEREEVTLQYLNMVKADPDVSTDELDDADRLG